MDSTRSIYRRITLVMIAVLFIVICSTYIYFIINIGRVYEEKAIESIIDVKKEMLKDIVDNLILEIGVTEVQEKQQYKKRTDNASKILQEYYEVSPEEYIDLFIDFCNTDGNKDVLSVAIKNTRSNQVLYKSGVFLSDAPKKADFSSYFLGQYEDYQIHFGVSNDAINNSVKQKISDRIRNRQYPQNTYIWVNEIKNYEGGKDYAIRVVHSELPNIEGEFLSTDSQDATDNYSYAEELESIPKKDAIFFDDHIEKSNNSIVPEKTTYVKRYKKYDWVIAMGVHLEDVESYINISAQEKDVITIKTIRSTIVFMLIIFMLYWLIISRAEQWYYQKYNKNLKDVFIDQLTQTKNRRSAIQHMEKSFKVFKKTGQSPMIMMIDIDDFKQINDTFGHLEGDIVLKNVAYAINNSIRDTDALYRWGGEEFLLICDRLKETDFIAFSNKIISIVGSKEYEFNGKKVKTTISIGVDRFDLLDKTYEEGIQRADIAMYRAKEQGKNRVCIGDICGVNPLI
ncbi:MAG TPA: diguanylate cyclase [Epulopiscium sp.]|nr:diguanylate cyclase [Candidatus Epulonipiscium sp.]